MARKPAKKPTAAATPAKQKALSPEAAELRQRIERLEERLDASILGDDGLAEIDAGLDKGIDKTPSGDPLERAVRRSNVKRGSRKA